MSKFPHFEYAIRDVRRAGEVISDNLLWTPERQEEIRRAFAIANNWRDSHAYPMRSIRYSLQFHVRDHNLTGFTAARLKRMPAIRRKLRRMKERGRPLNLNQLQDLGGCRAIMNTMEDVRTLVDVMKARSRHEFRGEDDYIASPKVDGYRSHHLKYAFLGREGSEVHNGRRIEIQVRTVLQHSWATSIEAVGLFRGEDLKGSDGNLQWLRLFQLMSAEFAEAEGCAPPPGLPERKERMEEIRELEADLNALNALDSLSHASEWNLWAVQPQPRPSHYLIEYDWNSKTVKVYPYYKPLFAVEAYDEAEDSAKSIDSDASNVVLVEVDKLDNLKRSYPNYFGDVQLFKRQLRLVTKGKAVSEFTVARQQAVPVPPVERVDPSWLRRRGRWS